MAFLLAGCAGTAMAQTTLAVSKVQPSVVMFGYCREGGQVETWEAKPGEKVSKGQLILKFDHARQLHAYESAKLRAESDAQLQSALGDLKQKQAALADSENRFKRRMIPKEVHDQAIGESDISRGKLTQAELNRKLSRLDLELAEKMLELRYIRSPMDGVLISIATAPGERAAQGDKTVVVADTDEVVSEMPLSGTFLNTLQEGATFPVRLAGSTISHSAKVVSILPMAGAKAGEKVVKLVFANADKTIPLNSQNYDILLPEGAKAATPPKPPASPPAAKK